MTADRCIPAPDAEDGSWHWVSLNGGPPLPAEWERGGWAPTWMPFSAVNAYSRGWRYLCPIPSSDALAALVKAARKVLHRCEELGVEKWMPHSFANLTAALADPAFKEHTND